MPKRRPPAKKKRKYIKMKHNQAHLNSIAQEARKWKTSQN